MFREMLNLLSPKGKRNLLLSGSFFTLYSLSSILMVLLVFSVFFRVLKGESFENLYLVFLLFLFLLIFKGFCNVIADLQKHNAGFDIVQQIREKMILQLKQFSLGFYTKERLGEINTVLHKDVDNMSMVVGHMCSRMIGDCMAAFFIFLGLSIFHWKLSLAMIIFLPVSCIFLFLSIQKSKRVENENNKALMNLVSFFVEYLRAIPVLKSFANNKSFDANLIEYTKKFEASSQDASKCKAKQLAIFGFLLDLSYYILFVVGALGVFYEKISLFPFLMFLLLSKEFYKPFVSLEMYYMYYISAADSYERLQKILAAENIVDKKDGIIPQNNTITFQNINFFYEEEEFQIKNLSFSIHENTMTALVGKSGSGKTTMTNLLLRFYEVNKGAITVGGVDIREIPYDELLSRISIVMQNVQLFANSVEENVRVGKKNASKEEIIEACKRARIHDFIMQLPKQYDTEIGENGILLSGGQRQRLSIARAFLKNAPILILDEMTSNVDPINEALIQDAVTELAENRTVLVIAHHLKTIKNADQILVFQAGTLVEQGIHEELLQKGGYYFNLWQAQQ